MDLIIEIIMPISSLPNHAAMPLLLHSAADFDANNRDLASSDEMIDDDDGTETGVSASNESRQGLQVPL